MIRFVAIGNQVNEWANEFAFFDTIPCKFLTFGETDQTFDSRKGFEVHQDHELYERCAGLIPSNYTDTLDNPTGENE